MLSRLKLQRSTAFQVTEPIHDLAPEEMVGGKPYLLQFTGKGDDYCEAMEPLTKRLRDELGVKIRCFEVWYGTKNIELLQKLDRGRCGGVPFFYNTKSKRYICGATTYDNLKSWALCEQCDPFLPPPDLDKPPNLENDQGEVQAKVYGFLQGLKVKALKRMSERGS